MLIAYRIKNYRSFRDDTLISFVPDDSVVQNKSDVIIAEQPALKIMSIYGANASGKSSVLLALQTISRIVALDVDKTEISQVISAFKPDGKNIPTEFEIWFSCMQHMYHFGITFQNEHVIEEFLDVDDQVLVERTEDELSVHEDLAILKRLCKSEYSFVGTIRKLFPDSLGDILSPFYIFLLQKIFYSMYGITSYTKQTLNEKLYSDDNLYKKVAQLTSQIDTGISELDFIPGFSEHDSKILFTKHGDTCFSLDEESQGTINFIYFTTMMLTVIEKGDLLIIDELSASLHPLLTRFFIDYFCKNSTSAQLIFTTHDPTLMDNFLRTDEITIVTKDCNGISSVESLADYELSQSDASISSRYLGGRFMGVPTIRRRSDET